MVHYQRNQKKGGLIIDGDEDEESHHQLLGLVWGNNGNNNKRAKPSLLFLLLLSVLSCSLIFAPHLFSSSPPTFSLFYSFGFEGQGLASEIDINASFCSSVSNGTICCDRSSFRSDVCVMKGDVRTDPASSSIGLYRSFGYKSYILGLSDDDNDKAIQLEKIKPYTRKWETSVMDTIDELNLVVKNKNPGTTHHLCDVQHDVPAVVFSTGGYTGNLYHEFNDGILPLYITSQHFDRKVVFVILEYHNWWISKYENILSRLSNHRPIDFHDNRTHCFPEVIVGLRIHNELSINPLLMKGNKSIRDFRKLLDQSYWPRIRGLIQKEEREAQMIIEKSALSPSPDSSILLQRQQGLKSPRLVIIARNDSRAILNEDSMIKMAEEIGFDVEIVRPARTTELAKVYRVLNSSDVMIGVHGAAMTHFLFLKPDSVFIQIIPLGTDWAAEAYYGEPAKKMGLRYIGYKILPKESSLFDEYDSNDPVLNDPDSINKKGWEFTKKIYLDRQNVKLHLSRFRKRLLRAYYYTIAVSNGRLRNQNQ